ncbi:MAG: bacteriocin-protection protein [Candidatus Eisenbacteria bacterium]|uniref:Bacteriocin-protection protein n=1 Tax=Eiseniibacteriota bacterium TaxID=2212470 RepID=A0A849SJ21_UNCEI|nr:bacteriocin-protection protein [Candidatus Eisenbacteria bacterium]
MKLGTEKQPLFFTTPAALRRWFQLHHASAELLWLGYYKKGSGKPSVTWPESVDEALCVGWIDGVRKRVSDEVYVIRFTPRRPRSIWSVVNIGRVEALTKAGRMRAAGRAAFEKRTADRSGIYAFERPAAELSPASQRTLRANRKAWSDWQKRPPGYRRTVIHWVMSAKQEATRERRLAALIEACAAGRVIGPMTRSAP